MAHAAADNVQVWRVLSVIRADEFPWLAVGVAVVGLVLSAHACAVRAQPSYLHLDAGEQAWRAAPATEATAARRTGKRAARSAGRLELKARGFKRFRKAPKTPSRIVSHETESAEPIRPKPVPTVTVAPANTEPVEPPAVRFPFERFGSFEAPATERAPVAAPPIPVEVRSRLLPGVVILAGAFFLLCAAIIFGEALETPRRQSTRREPRFDQPRRREPPVNVVMLDHYRQRKIA